MSSITEEQRKRMEENRLKALQRLQQRQNGPSASSGTGPNLPSVKPQYFNSTENPRPALNTPALGTNSVSSYPKPNHLTTQTNPPKKNYPWSSNKVSASSTTSSHSSLHFQNHNSSTKPSSSPSKATPDVFYGKTTKVILQLVSKDWFEADLPYMKQVIDIFKTIAGYKYDTVSKKWSFPIGQHGHLVNSLRPLRPHVVVAELPKSVFTLLNMGKINVPEETVMTRLEPALASTLMDFQKEGVNYAISREGRVLIADDMGLGKTIQALAIASYYKKDWPLLIVCPSSMRFQWKEEIGTHMPSVPPHHVFVMVNSKDFMDVTTRILITSYDLMVNQSSDLLKKHFGVVIMDESHHLKNPKTARTKVATEIITHSRRCILLSGTPVLSRPQELYCQLRAVRPKLFQNFMDFGVRYCDGKKERFGWNFSGSSNMRELSIVLQEALMIRRLKADVLSQLPPKRREVVVVDVGENHMLGDMSILEERLQQEGLKGVEKKSCLLEYFSTTGKAKISAVSQYVLDTIENGEKFLVFAHHSSVLDAICQTIKSKKKQYIRIDGSTSSEDRKLQCLKFQNDEDYLVAVLSIRAASTGLTLTAARLVVFAELFWNPGDLIQAEDRVHRIGQYDSVLIKYLIAHGTADDHIWPMIRSKLELLNKVGLSKETFESADIIKKKDSQGSILDYLSQPQSSEGIDSGFGLDEVNWSEFDDPM